MAKAYRLLKTILNTAVTDEVLPRNPRLLRGAGSERMPERVPPTLAEAYALAEAIQPRWRMLVLLATWSGLRWGELVALRRSSVGLEQGRVTVANQLVETATGVSAITVIHLMHPNLGTPLRPELAADVLREHRVPTRGEASRDLREPGVGSVLVVGQSNEDDRERAIRPRCVEIRGEAGAISHGGPAFLGVVRHRSRDQCVRTSRTILPVERWVRERGDLDGPLRAASSSPDIADTPPWPRNAGSQTSRVLVLRVVEYPRSLSALDNLARPHDDDIVGQLTHNSQVVTDQYVGDVHLIADVGQQVQDLGLDRHVECRYRLIEDQHRWFGGKRPRYRNPLPLATGQ